MDNTTATTASHITIINSEFHDSRVMSHHRDAIVAANKLATMRAVHGRECSCYGASIVVLSRKFPVGYNLSQSELAEYSV